MKRYVTCASCGSKMRPGRTACLRCGLPLEAAPARPAAAPGQRRQKRWLAAFVAASAVIVMGLLGLPDRAPTNALQPSAKPAAEPTAGATDFARDAGLPAANEPSPYARAWESTDPMQAGRLALARGDAEAALERFRVAAETRPDDPAALTSYGQMLVRFGREQEAFPYLEQAASLEPSRWAHRFNLARCHGLLGRWEAAVKEYRAAAELFPGDYATHFNLAMALRHIGDDEGSVHDLLAAIEARPDDPTFHVALGQAYERLGRREEAEAAYENAERLRAGEYQR